METKLLLDRLYTLSKSKSNHKFLFLTNQGIVVKRNYNSILIASRILLSEKGYKKYLKCLLMLASLFIAPIKGFSEVIFLNQPDVYLIFFGRSKRVKLIKKEEIVNKINDDYFSKTDFYIRRKINNRNISPKITEIGETYFKEERLTKFKYADNLNTAKQATETFKNTFKTVHTQSDLYIQKLIKKITFLDAQTGSNINLLAHKLKHQKLDIRISHGDLVRRNIIIKNQKKYLIDFEFCAYRSTFYDNLFEDYYLERNQFFSNKSNLSIVIFLLERLCLTLKLQEELKISYHNEISSILNYLNTKA